MKKKLNLFCLLMLIVMAAQIVISIALGFGEHAQAFKEGWEDGGKPDATFTFGLLGTIFLILGGLIVLYLIIRSFVSFVRFILNVNRNKVFVWDNVVLLRRTGWGLLIIALIMTIHDLMVQIPLESIYNDTIDKYIFSVFSLIVAEVFAIGLKLKEEHDLTI